MPIDPTTHWPAQLAQGLDGLGLALTANQQQSLLDYLALLARWNRVYNLTAVRQPDEMVRRQLLDSLSILPWLEPGPVLDVGTGAGLPGLPLAIARPDQRFRLLDTNGKKTRFVQQAVAELKLLNAQVVKCRVETLQPTDRYRCITSRAFATLADMVELTAHLVDDAGCWLAMKGVSPDAEIAALPPGLDVVVERLQVPGEAGDRHLVVIRRQAQT